MDAHWFREDTAGRLGKTSWAIAWLRALNRTLFQ